MATASQENPTELPPRKKRKWLWYFIPAAGLLLLCLLIIGGVYFYLNQLRTTARADQWGPENSTAGMQLNLVEMARTQDASGTVVVYSLTSVGLPADQTFTLWARNFSGEAASVVGEVRTDPAGKLVDAAGSPIDRFQVSRMALGQAVNFKLSTADESIKVFAKTIPFPLEATDGKGCRLSAELMSRDGTVFHITGEGFEPNEALVVTSSSEGEIMNLARTAEPDGTFAPTILYPAVVGKTSGSASYRVIGSGCDLTLQYQWGPPALEIQ